VCHHALHLPHTARQGDLRFNGESIDKHSSAIKLIQDRDVHIPSMTVEVLLGLLSHLACLAKYNPSPTDPASRKLNEQDTLRFVLELATPPEVPFRNVLVDSMLECCLRVLGIGQ
jgi:hypothetical protein